MAEKNGKSHSNDSVGGDRKGSVLNNIIDSDEDSEREFAKHLITSVLGGENAKRNSPLSERGTRQSPLQVDEERQGGGSEPNRSNSKPVAPQDQLDDELSDDDLDNAVKSPIVAQKPNSSPPQSRLSPKMSPPNRSGKNSPDDKKVTVHTPEKPGTPNDTKLKNGNTSPFRNSDSRQLPNTSPPPGIGSKTGSISNRPSSSLFSDRVFVADHFAPNDNEDALEAILHDSPTNKPSVTDARDDRKPSKNSSPEFTPLAKPSRHADFSEDEEDEEEDVDIVDGSKLKISSNRSSQNSLTGNQQGQKRNDSPDQILNNGNKGTKQSPRNNGGQEREANGESPDGDDVEDFRHISTSPFVNRNKPPFDLKFMTSITTWATEDLSRALKQLREKRELIVQRQNATKNRPLSTWNKPAHSSGTRRVIPRDYLDGDDLWATESDAIMTSTNLNHLKSSHDEYRGGLDDNENVEVSGYDNNVREYLSPLIARQNNAIRELVFRRKLAVGFIRRANHADELRRPIHDDYQVRPKKL